MASSAGSSTKFNYQAANQWKNEVDDLIEEENALLVQVYQVCEEVGDGCKGAIVEQLKQNAKEMCDKFQTLVNAVKELITQLGNIINGFKEFEDTAVEFLGNVAAGIANALF